MAVIKHNCINCEYRHNGGWGECSENYMDDNCPSFKLGKCFRCKHNNSDNSLCMAEDMSGYNCPNFEEEDKMSIKFADVIVEEIKNRNLTQYAKDSIGAVFSNGDFERYMHHEQEQDNPCADCSNHPSNGGSGICQIN